MLQRLCPFILKTHRVAEGDRIIRCSYVSSVYLFLLIVIVNALPEVTYIVLDSQEGTDNRAPQSVNAEMLDRTKPMHGVTDCGNLFPMRDVVQSCEKCRSTTLAGREERVKVGT